MGAKNASGGANADRARENQRRSRARKREYIASLEERLRRYHEAGVKVIRFPEQHSCLHIYTYT